MEFETRLATRAAQVEELLRVAVATWRQSETNPPELFEAAEAALLAGGKRLRPSLVLETARLCGLKSEAEEKACEAAAVALEAIHCFSLIHDDLPALDDSDTRRGSPSLHKQYGEATALLAGDWLLLQGLAHVQKGQGSCLELTQVLSGATAAMIAGQAQEMQTPPKSEAAWLAIAQGKTCALFMAACESGAVSAEADSPTRALLGEFGRNFGICFQLLDDIHDFEKDCRADPPTNFAVLFGRGRTKELLAERLAHARQNLGLLKLDSTQTEFHNSALAWLEEKLEENATA